MNKYVKLAKSLKEAQPKKLPDTRSRLSTKEADIRSRVMNNMHHLHDYHNTKVHNELREFCRDYNETNDVDFQLEVKPSSSRYTLSQKFKDGSAGQVYEIQTSISFEPKVLRLPFSFIEQLADGSGSINSYYEYQFIQNEHVNELNIDHEKRITTYDFLQQRPILVGATTATIFHANRTNNTTNIFHANRTNNTTNQQIPDHLAVLFSKIQDKEDILSFTLNTNYPSDLAKPISGSIKDDAITIQWSNDGIIPVTQLVVSYEYHYGEEEVHQKVCRDQFIVNYNLNKSPNWNGSNGTNVNNLDDLMYELSKLVADL